MNNRQSHLKRSYDLSEADYDSMGESQGWRCAICRGVNPARPDGSPTPLYVDHNKVTNAIRELLCQKCNLLIGFAGPSGDSQEILLRALFYLRKHNGSETVYIEDNPETRAARDAAFEQSLLDLSAKDSPRAKGISSFPTCAGN